MKLIANMHFVKFNIFVCFNNWKLISVEISVVTQYLKNVISDKSAEEKRISPIPGLKLENIIKMDVEALGYESVECVHLAQNRTQRQNVVKAALNIRIP
jgi:hypothetical protein